MYTVFWYSVEQGLNLMSFHGFSQLPFLYLKFIGLRTCLHPSSVQSKRLLKLHRFPLRYFAHYT